MGEHHDKDNSRSVVTVNTSFNWFQPCDGTTVTYYEAFISPLPTAGITISSFEISDCISEVLITLGNGKIIQFNVPNDGVSNFSADVKNLKKISVRSPINSLNTLCTGGVTLQLNY